VRPPRGSVGSFGALLVVGLALGRRLGSLGAAVVAAVGDAGVEPGAGVARVSGVDTVGSAVLAGEQPAASRAVINGSASRERRDNTNHFLNRLWEGSNLHTDARPG
jgi:hypothetical protein